MSLVHDVIVSVIIPVYNREYCVAKSINSALDQTFRSLEVIVVDDNSSDGTVAVVENMKKADERIKIIKNKENLGPAGARNKGIVLSRGKYIAFLDSDDEWYKEKISVQFETMENMSDEVGVCICGAMIIKNKDIKKSVIYMPKKSMEEGAYRKLVLGRLPFLTPTILIRSSVVKKIGLMNSYMRNNEDAEFLMRILHDYRLCVIEDVMVEINMIVSRDKRRDYEGLKMSLPFLLAHENNIKNSLGYNDWVWFITSNACNLVTSAIRERRWREALISMWWRIKIYPVLFPRDIVQITKSLLSK